MFITNFNANCNVNFFYLLYLLIDKINSYLLTRSIKATCKNSPNSLTNSFLNLHIWKFKRSNISGTEYKLTKISFEKYKSLGWGLKLYTALLDVSDIDANSFEHFQLGALNSEKDEYLRKEETLFETNMKLCNMCKID